MDTVYSFSPGDDTTYIYTVKNDSTTCYISDTFRINVSKVEPKIIAVDSCGMKRGLIYAIKYGSVQNVNSIKWGIDKELGEIVAGENSSAIIVDWKTPPSDGELSVVVRSNAGCGGETSREIPKGRDDSSFLKKGKDTLAFETCGAIIYDRGARCPDSTYYVGYIDHETGKYVRDTTGTPYYVDLTRTDQSKRTYFVICSDCEETNFINYREVQQLIDEGCGESKKELEVLVHPNPARSQFVLTFTGPYRGEITYNIFNSLGQLVNENTCQKDAGEKQEYIDTGAFVNGLYNVLVMPDNGKKYAFKIIVMK